MREDVRSKRVEVQKRRERNRGGEKARDSREDVKGEGEEK